MNIFARELALILAAHDKELSSLFSLHSPDVAIHPSTVTRLKRSLKEPITVLLNADQLSMLKERLALTDEEMRRLRAALLAETVHRVLAGRMAVGTAAELADILFQMLLNTDSTQMQDLRDRLLEETRGMRDRLRGVLDEMTSPPFRANEESISALLEPAAETYYQGLLWLELARTAPDYLAQRGYSAHARVLLAAAHDLALHAPSQALNTPQQSEWLILIEAALEDADLLG